MRSLARKLSLLFAAGAFGGLMNSLALWILGRIGVTTAIGVKLAPRLTPYWLYPRVTWGGLWALVFLLPVYQRSPLKRGFLLSLGPTAVQLFYVFPFKAHKGMFGLDLGLMTPLVVVLLNAVWGVSAAYWLRILGEE